MKNKGWVKGEEKTAEIFGMTAVLSADYFSLFTIRCSLLFWCFADNIQRSAFGFIIKATNVFTENTK